MAYNNQLSRTDIAPLIPEDVLESFLVDLTDTSVALTAFRKVPVAQSQTRFPILSALPIAYWVAGDTGLKQTTEMAWGNKFLNVEELAAIAPIPERVMDDLNEGGVGGGIDIWSEIQPTIVAEMARVIDQAIFFGVNAPASFPQNVLAACQAVLPTANTHRRCGAGRRRDPGRHRPVLRTARTAGLRAGPDHRRAHASQQAASCAYDDRRTARGTEPGPDRVSRHSDLASDARNVADGDRRCLAGGVHRRV